jgi:hypothetical protein
MFQPHLRPIRSVAELHMLLHFCEYAGMSHARAAAVRSAHKRTKCQDSAVGCETAATAPGVSVCVGRRLRMTHARVRGAPCLVAASSARNLCINWRLCTPVLTFNP